MRNSSVIGRIAAIGAIVLAIVVVAVLIMSSSSSYKVRAIFQNASQIVKGDQVEVAGDPIGAVSDIKITPDNQAELTFSINNSNYQPLHQGSIATVRLSSLSGIANRYIDLRLGQGGSPAIPNNGMIPSTYTTSAVDLDELFNTLNPATLKGLRDVFQGSASEYDRQGAAIQQALAYLNPSLVATSTEFREINRDTSRFTKFIVKTSGLVTDLASRSSDLSGLVEHLSTVTEALQAQQTALGESIRKLPDFMRLADTTFVNLRAALKDLTPLVDASKPVLPKLNEYLQQLKPLVQEASCGPGIPNADCVVHNLATLICNAPNGCSVNQPNYPFGGNPGNNDLIQLTELGVPLAAAACGTGPNATNCLGRVFANGKLRPAAFHESAVSLNGSSPEVATDRPYTADLTGWFEGYSHVGLIDANGGASRIETVLGLQSIGTGAAGAVPIPQPGLPALGPLQPVQSFLSQLFGAPGGNGLLTTGQGDRCPGSIERGGLWYPPSAHGDSRTGTNGRTYWNAFPCNPNERPTGQ